MSKYKGILSSLLGKAYKMSQVEVADLLDKSEEELDEQEVLTTLLGKHTGFIDSLRTRVFAEGAKKSEATAKKAFFSNLRTEFEVEDDVADDAIFETIKTKLSAGSSGAGKLTDDDVKKHPAFIRAENDYKKNLKGIQTQHEEALKGVHSSYARKEISNHVTKKASDIFIGLKPVLSKDQTKAANQVKNFVSRFSSLNWEEADGEFYQLDEEGKRKDDKLGHAISLSSFVKAEAENEFDFIKADDRRGAGEHHEKGKNGEGGKTTYTGKLPSTDSEYRNLMNDKTLSLADRKEIHQHWEKQQQPAEA